MEAASLVFNDGGGVYDLSFSVKPGSILGLIGPSGCGKTTTIRLLTGIYRPTAGIVRVFGKNPAEFLDSDKVRIGYVPQHFIMYQNLSVEENLHFMGGMYGTLPGNHTQKMEELLEFFDLHRARRRLGKHLSGGMQRRLMLAGALLHNPELVFADEPTGGIDPILRERVWQHFRKLRDHVCSLLVTTQYVGEAAYCDKVAVMRNGKLIDLDTPDALRRKAMGGDIIRLKVKSRQVFKVMDFLNNLKPVKRVEQVKGEKEGIFVLVKNSGKEIPGLLAALHEHLGITPKAVEPYSPPFDEVFVRLMEHSEVT